MFDQLADIRHAMGYNTGTDRDSGVASLGRILLSQLNNSRLTVTLENYSRLRRRQRRRRRTELEHHDTKAQADRTELSLIADSERGPDSWDSQIIQYLERSCTWYC